MLVIGANKDQKDYRNRLKNEIVSFTINFTKRYNLFPWKEVNKIPKISKYQFLPIVVRGEDFLVKDLVKKINKNRFQLKAKLKPHFYDYVIKAYSRDCKGKYGLQLKKVYDTYETELQLIFKNVQDNLNFCIESLQAINKAIKEYDKTKKVVKESEEYTMIEKKKIINPNDSLAYESFKNTTLVDANGDTFDIRDFIIETYVESFDDYDDETEDVTIEGVNIDASKIFKEKRKQIRDKMKIAKINYKKKNYDVAINNLEEADTMINEAIEDIQSLNFNSISATILGNLLYDLLALLRTSVLCATVIGIIPAIIINLKDGINGLLEYLNEFRDTSKELDVSHYNYHKRFLIIRLKDLRKATRKMIEKCEKESGKVKVAQTEVNKADAEVKESAYYKDMKLSIYESCRNGEITVEEQNELLNELESQKFVADTYNEHTYYIDNDDNKAKFEKVKLALYEKCKNGEITVEEREELISTARDMILTEADSPQNGMNKKSSLIETAKMIKDAAVQQKKVDQTVEKLDKTEVKPEQK